MIIKKELNIKIYFGGILCKSGMFLEIAAFHLSGNLFVRYNKKLNLRNILPSAFVYHIIKIIIHINMQFASPTILVATEKLAPQAIKDLERYLLQNTKFPTCFVHRNEFSIFSNTNKMTPTKFQKVMIERLNSIYEVNAYKKGNNKNTIYAKNFPIAFLSYDNNYYNLHCKSILNYDSKPMLPYKKADFTDDNVQNDFNFELIEMFNDMFLKKELWSQNTYQVNQWFLEQHGILPKSAY
jgi:hypothetical protein